MWSRLFASLALAMSLGIGPGLAQQTPTEPAPSMQQPQPPAAVQNAPNAETKPSDMIGWSVYSADGKNVGYVIAVKIAANGKPASIQAGVGGFLGLGARTVQLDAGKFSIGDKRIRLSMTEKEVEALPTLGAK